MKNELIEKIERVRNVQKDIEERIKFSAKELAEVSERVANGDLSALDDIEYKYQWLEDDVKNLNHYKSIEAVYNDLLKNEVA